MGVRDMVWAHIIGRETVVLDLINFPHNIFLGRRVIEDDG